MQVAGIQQWSGCNSAADKTHSNGQQLSNSEIIETEKQAKLLLFDNYPDNRIIFPLPHLLSENGVNIHYCDRNIILMPSGHELISHIYLWEWTLCSLQIKHTLFPRLFNVVLLGEQATRQTGMANNWPVMIVYSSVLGHYNLLRWLPSFQNWTWLWIDFVLIVFGLWCLEWKDRSLFKIILAFLWGERTGINVSCCGWFCIYTCFNKKKNAYIWILKPLWKINLLCIVELHGLAYKQKTKTNVKIC